MRASIVALARLVARVDALDREIKSLGFTQVRHVLASASPEIAALLGESFTYDGFLALARRDSRTSG